MLKPILLTSILMLTLASCVQPNSLNSGSSSDSSLRRNGDMLCSDDPIDCPSGLSYIDNQGACRVFCPELVSGYDMKGELTSCYDTTASDRMNCATVMMEGDYYGLRCQELGGDTISCGCHNNLCSIDISEGGAKQFGLDDKGHFRGCVPSATLGQCDGNAFTQQCEQTGQKVIACSCEQFLCTTP